MNSENIIVGPYGETYPASHDAKQSVNIKAEHVLDPHQEAYPVRITIQEIKAEPEVSCMFLYAHCHTDITNMQKYQFSFSSLSLWLSVCLCT
jgi:hypothetical protein